MDIRHEYDTVAPLFGPLRTRHIDDFRLGKRLVAQLRHAASELAPISPAGWMYIIDAKKFCPELTQGIVLRILSRQKDEDKDRFLVLGLAHDDCCLLYTSDAADDM
eukprot:9079877-Prorocentrum_lima.AAC.1